MIPVEQQAAAAAASARRVETPCGAGSMVWRIWGSGAPVLLAHGAQGAWSHWIRNIPALAATRTVIACDLPGCGESASPPSGDHESISAALASGLRSILGEPVGIDLVGFSLGASILAWFANLHPAWARRLVLVAAGGLGTPVGSITLKKISGLSPAERDAVLKANLLSLMLHHPDSADELARHLLLANARLSRLEPMPLVQPDRLLAALAGVRCRIDAIWGEFDAPHPALPQEAVLRQLRPGIDFRVIAGAGHWVMYEKPADFDAALEVVLGLPTGYGALRR
jgi:pimeloyl-ACP methyl ester carboxylesterase